MSTIKIKVTVTLLIENERKGKRRRRQKSNTAGTALDLWTIMAASDDSPQNGGTLAQNVTTVGNHHTITSCLPVLHSVVFVWVGECLALTFFKNQLKLLIKIWSH